MAKPEILEALAYSHTLPVMRYLESEPRRFTDITKGLDLNPNIVNTRLKDLRMAGLAEKVEIKDTRRHRYRLTDLGRESLEIAEQIADLEEDSN